MTTTPLIAAAASISLIWTGTADGAAHRNQAATVPAAVQNAGCHPGLLKGATDSDYGYAPRDGRCEGTYSVKVANPTLYLVSLTEHFEDFDADATKSIVFEWSTPADYPVRLRVRSVKRKFYYGMDTERPSTSRSYDWPSNIRTAAGRLGRQDMGVVGWYVDGAGQDVYLPLRIHQTEPATRDGTYEVRLFPGRKLDTLFVSVAKLDSNGQVVTTIMDNQRRTGFFPAGRTITIPISGLGAKGTYRLRIGATYTEGDKQKSAVFERLFYHAGP